MLVAQNWREKIIPHKTILKQIFSLYSSILTNIKELFICFSISCLLNDFIIKDMIHNGIINYGQQ
jgi:hypothetical protein